MKDISSKFMIKINCSSGVSVMVSFISFRVLPHTHNVSSYAYFLWALPRKTDVGRFENF